MPSPVSFGTRLRQAMDARGPLCVGIDPHPALLEAWGLANSAEGVREFSLRVVEAMAGVAAIVKPQVALYERFGSAGFAALEETLQAAKAADLLTLSDAKRGDIGSTMAAYATAWLDDASPLASDAVTLSPYLGYESLRPAIDLAAATGRGVFVLGLTSNPEGASVQHVGGDKSVAKSIIEQVSKENAAAEDMGHPPGAGHQQPRHPQGRSGCAGAARQGPQGSRRTDRREVATTGKVTQSRCGQESFYWPQRD